ncbi:baculoviral IAP repeat-containing protein 7 isoform 1-T1 [Mantella aurantiaca]
MFRWSFTRDAAMDEGACSRLSANTPGNEGTWIWRLNSRSECPGTIRWRFGQNTAMDEADDIRAMLGSWGPPRVDTVSTPVKDGMRREVTRLRSFRNWPAAGIVSPHQMAWAGFFYLGPRDRVQCFCCGGILRSWEPGDHPGAEHRKYFPSCPFMLGRDVGNVPLTGATDSVDGQILGQLQRLPGQEDDWQAVYPDLLEESERLGTFHNWPQSTGMCPEQLARAGFFYTGRRDSVRCFHCDGELRHWEQGDDPWREHAKWFPRCEFLVQSMGPAYIRSVQDAAGGDSPQSSPESQGTSERSPSTPSDSPGGWQDFLQSSIVQEALGMGFDESLVTSVVQSRFLLVGTPHSCLPELVTELIEAEEESVPHTPEPAWTPESPAQRPASQPPKPETSLSAEEQLERLKEEKLCKVCMDKDVSMVFVPCGHLVVCMDCAPSLRHCPICRAAIRGSMRAFMS